MKGQLIVILKSAASRLSTLFHELKEIIVMSIQWRKLFIIFSARSNQQIWFFFIWSFLWTYCNGMIISPFLIGTNHFMASARTVCSCCEVLLCPLINTHMLLSTGCNASSFSYMYHSVGRANHWKTTTQYQTLLAPFVQLGLVLLHVGPAL